MKQLVRKILKQQFNLEITHGQGDQPAEFLIQVDEFFNRQYDRGRQVTGTSSDYENRRQRFYNLAQFLMQTEGVEGQVAECGCWKGLSSFILCQYAKQADPRYDGTGYHIFDSFEGLSEPTAEDALSARVTKNLIQKHGKVAGAFEAPMEQVASALGDFPAITFFKGWIPHVFATTPEARYRFVHVDLDLYEPIAGAIAYFYPRLNPNGMIIFDDYGSLFWPGAKRAVDEFCQANGLTPLVLSTGQAVVWKR